MEKIRKTIAIAIAIVAVIISMYLLRDIVVHPNGYYISQDVNPYPMFTVLGVGGLIAIFLWFGWQEEKAIPCASMFAGILIFLVGMFGGIVCLYYWGIRYTFHYFFVATVVAGIMMFIGFTSKKFYSELD